MMTKNDIRTFDDLIRFSDFRAKKSLKRNDPWAMAYWMETKAFAVMGKGVSPITDWVDIAQRAASLARFAHTSGRHLNAALWYSRAKWYVIMGRNNGVTMNPRVTGVNKTVFNNERSA